MRIAVLVLAASCYRQATPPPPVVVAPPHVEPAGFIASTDPLAFLPTDADAVIAIDARAIKSSQTWKQLAPAIQPKLDALLALFKGTCNFDPIAAVKQMSLAIRDPGGANSTGVWVVRGYDKKQVIACIEAASKLDQRSVKIDRDVIEIGGTGFVGFADATTLVGVYGAGATRQTLLDALDGGAPLRVAPEFPALIEKLEQRHAWFVMMGSAKALQQSAAFGAKPVAIIGGLDAGADVDAQVRMRFAAPDQATAATALLQTQLPNLSSFLPGITASTDDIDTVLDLHITAGQLQMILGLVVP